MSYRPGSAKPKDVGASGKPGTSPLPAHEDHVHEGATSDHTHDDRYYTESEVDTEIDTDIATHAGAADPHGDRAYADGLDHDHATPIATHAADVDAHHAKYTDAEVDTRIGLADLADLATKPHSALTGVGETDHHDHDGGFTMVTRTTTGFTLTTGSWTEIDWNAEVQDPSGWWEGVTNPDHIDPSDLSGGEPLLLIAKVTFSANSATSLGVRILDNGAVKATITVPADNAIQQVQCVLPWMHVSTHVYTVEAYHDHGSDLTTRTGQDEMSFSLLAIPGV